jgi:uncharacterized surface protein with fasciclin (FAS1) repeats
MKAFIAILVLSCALAGVQARQLKQARSAAEALAGDSRLSTLNAAVKASGLSIPDGSTIFAPTNEAFADKGVQKKTGLAAADLLKPENKQALIDLLKHHIVPPTVSQSSSQITKQKKIGPVTVSVVAQGASSTTTSSGITTSQMTEGQMLPTLLGSSLRVDRNDADGTIEIDVPGTVDDGPEDPEDAAIKQGDIQAGKTIIHIVDEVLVPASGSLRKSASG